MGDAAVINDGAGGPETPTVPAILGAALVAFVAYVPIVIVWYAACGEHGGWIICGSGSAPPLPWQGMLALAPGLALAAGLVARLRSRPNLFLAACTLLGSAALAVLVTVAVGALTS